MISPARLNPTSLLRPALPAPEIANAEGEGGILSMPCNIQKKTYVCYINCLENVTSPFLTSATRATIGMGARRSTKDLCLHRLQCFHRSISHELNE